MTNPRLGRFISHCVCVLFVAVCLSLEGVQPLSMWIDGRETEQFVGEPMNIYVIVDGVVVPFLKDAIYDAALPILPPEVRLVHLTWKANNETYFYKFTDIRSLDPNTLYDPLLSIPKFGMVPANKTDLDTSSKKNRDGERVSPTQQSMGPCLFPRPELFQMTIPCTGGVTGIASMYIVLHIHNGRGKPIKGSPIKLHLRKRCIAFAESRRMCIDGCHNGGTCNEAGHCDCAKGYYGDQCQLAVCFPGCMNNGTCIKPGQCACPGGYMGNSCETAICRKSCQNGGYCFRPGLCDCPDGFYGNQCQHKEGHCEPPCVNGGTCACNNTCLCLDGYTGQFCQRAYCRQSCGVNGFCADVNECQCYRGWRGRFCHKTKNNIGRQKDRNHKGRKGRKKTKLRHGRDSERPSRGQRKTRQSRPKSPEKRKKKKRRTLV